MTHRLITPGVECGEVQAFAAGEDAPGRTHFAMAVYGGAFDPPHPGHASVIERILGYAGTVLVVPSYRHAHGKRMADFELRCTWVRRLAARFGGQRVICTDAERQLGEHGAVVYSYDLMAHLARRYGMAGEEMALVIGEDNHAGLKDFHRGRELRERFGLLVAREALRVHSSQIRARVADGLPIPRAWRLPEMEGELMVYRSAM